MGVSTDRLSNYLDDYFQVSGRKTERFVCPISLEECDEADLIDAHILNKKLTRASRRKVVQFSRIDHFYGTRLEPGLVRFLNLRDASQFDLLKASGEFQVKLSDGRCVSAFLAGSRAAKKADGRFPLIDLISDGKPVASAYLRITNAASLAVSPVEVTSTFPFSPFDWTGALLKAAHLALFDLLGYKTVFDPYGDTLRRTLHQYFEDRAKRIDAEKYFGDFRDAVKIIANGSRSDHPAQDYLAYPFDTLSDREFLVHRTPSNVMFALTCIFKINDATISVMVPQSTPEGDPKLVLDWYKQCAEDPLALPQSVHRCRHSGAEWKVEQTPQKLGLLPN